MRARHATRPKRILAAIALLGALTLTAAARPAFAGAYAYAKITNLEFNANNASWPQLVLQLGDPVSATFLGQQPPPGGCPSFPTISAESIRAFHAIAQAAFLNDKPIQLYYNTCGPYNYISDVKIFNYLPPP